MSAMQVQPTPAISRRRLLQITATMGGLLLTGGAVAGLGRPRPHTQHAVRWLMGTTVHLTVIGPSAAATQHAIDRTFNEMARLVALFDHRQPTSALAKLNQTGILDQPPAELVTVMQRARDFGELTDGAFDVTVKPLLDAYRTGMLDIESLQALVDYRQITITPDQIRLVIPGASITLDGIAKGWIIDAALQTLRSLGYNHLLVEAGGDLRTLGVRQDNTPWRVGIVHPRQPDTIMATLAVGARAVATSGDYMNSFTPDFALHHILDPHSGRSPSDLAAVTILAPAALDADALATALMVLDSDTGLALIARLPGYGCVTHHQRSPDATQPWRAFCLAG